MIVNKRNDSILMLQESQDLGGLNDDNAKK
jgi:hypothetical protein